MGFDYAGYFGEIATLHQITTRPEERTWRLAPPPREGEPHRVVLYLGCNVLRTSHLVRTVTAIFDRLGLDYVAVGGPTYCCGIVHHRESSAAAGQGKSHATIELFKRFAPEEVVMWCPSCIHFYDDILGQPLPFPVSHASEFLAARLGMMTLSRPAAGPETVALHQHVVGEARQREGAAARRLLAAVPGLRVVDLEQDPRFGYTCSPAIQQQVGAETWNGLVRDVLARAHAAGAGALATIYHGCQRMMCAFEPGQPVAVEHYLTVFGRALGLEFEDTFKKYRLWQDPDRVLADVSPCMTASGVDPARARAVIARTFPA